MDIYFRILFVIPFGYSEFTEITWQEIPTSIYYFNISFVILGCILAYLINGDATY
jgi:DMSO reductase anchor subunit